MATRQPVLVLPPTVNPNLYPSPLHIRKKARRSSRRATFYRRIIRKSTHQYRHQVVHGPLDDIITEISSDIWASPSEWDVASAVLPLSESLGDLIGHHNPLKAVSTCTISTVTPLPVSRTPSAQPLTIRKNRCSRSTASESSATHSAMSSSRRNSREKHTESGKVCGELSTETTPWPQIDGQLQPESEPTTSNNTICLAHTPAQQALEEAQSGETKRRSSRARLFTHGLTRLLRSVSESKATDLPTHVKNDDGDVDGAVEAPSDTSIGSTVNQVARGVQTTLLDNGHGTDATHTRGAQLMPIVVQTATNVISEVKVFQTDQEQEFWVNVEIEGVLHNRRELEDSSIDIIFIIDNGYYVSKDCLERALQAATGGLHQLDMADRVALYATHCTHGSVATTVPDKLLPLRYMSTATEQAFQDLAMDIEKHGVQAWSPARPTPPMANMILAVLKSLESPRLDRCQVVLLSPVLGALHTVSDTYPNVQIHHINPAALPFIKDNNSKELICRETCCMNVFIKNWTHHQSVLSCIKQLITQARSEAPLASIGDLRVDLRPNSGCRVLKIVGPTAIKNLRSGDTLSFLARLRVTPEHTLELQESLLDAVHEDILAAGNLRHETYVAETLDAKLAYLLSVQVYYKTILDPPGILSYTETPLVVFTKLGRLSFPRDLSLDVYKRRAFYVLNQADPDMAKRELESLTLAIPDAREDMKEIIQQMAKEIYWHHTILEYETLSRQNLPLCLGPIEIAPADNHDHIHSILNGMVNRHRGMTAMW